MAHKFKVINKSKLDSPKRREVLPAKEILNTVGIKESNVVADIGCGIGFFTFPLSEAVGDEGIDVAFLCTVMHEVKMREKFLKEANRILYPGGRIIIIEWIRKDSDFGPPADHRLDENILKRNLKRAGYKDIQITEFNDYFYIADARKK